MRERSDAQLSVVENLRTIERMKDIANHELEKKVVERTVIIEKQKWQGLYGGTKKIIQKKEHF